MKKASITFAMFGVIVFASSAAAQSSMGDMKGMDASKKSAAVVPETHMVEGTVKKVDKATGTVTLSHGPVKSLNWPAMTMGFKVADKSMLNKFEEGKKVTVEVSKVNSDYEIKAVK